MLYEELGRIRTMERLVIRAALGTHGASVKAALVQRVGPGERGEVIMVVDATLAAIARHECSVETLARSVHMSPATLGRVMRAAGLTTPSRFIYRLRVILAILLRADRATRSRAWKMLGFGSPVHLTNSIRAHLGRSVREVDRMAGEGRLSDSIERLLLDPARERAENLFG
jgi:AraC-like DNA-binding protein